MHRVLAHEVSLTQALGNLLGNGVKFVKPGERPHTTIWSEAQEGRVIQSDGANGSRLWIEVAAAGDDKQG